jgi:hypothetical protein
MEGENLRTIQTHISDTDFTIQDSVDHVNHVELPTVDRVELPTMDRSVPKPVLDWISFTLLAIFPIILLYIVYIWSCVYGHYVIADYLAPNTSHMSEGSRAVYIESSLPYAFEVCRELVMESQ